MLEELFGIRVNKEWGKITHKRGVLGMVEAYIRTVEAQGQGTLHLHMLLWLTGAPTPSQMKQLLHTEQFQKRVSQYIGSIIKASLDDEDSQTVPGRRRSKESILYSRPVNPVKEDYEKKAIEAE